MIDTFINALSEGIIGFFSSPAWLVPMAIAFVMQVFSPQPFKKYIPPEWPGMKRDLVIRSFSVFMGMFALISARWAMLSLEGEPFNMAQFVITGWVGVALILLTTFVLYDKILSEKTREKLSYRRAIENRKRMKTVRLPDGSFEMRAYDQPSQKGEKTITGVGEEK